MPSKQLTTRAKAARRPRSADAHAAPLDQHEFRLELRAMSDALIRRAEFLSPSDRALILAFFQSDLSTSAIAALQNEKTPAIRRRLRILTTRLLSPRFAFVQARLPLWDPARAAVARLCFLEGVPMRTAARCLGLSLHSVRQHHLAISALADAHHPRPSSTSSFSNSLKASA